MASEITRAISKRLKLGNVSTSLIDGQLQEVREVLDALQTKYYGDNCWCDVEVRRGSQNAERHTETCQRARELMKCLNPKGE